MDNSETRLIEVFFYGLYMDGEILKSKNVIPRNPRKGKVKNYILRIGKMATLLREEGGTAHGMLYSLTHSEIHSLYQGAGLDCYSSEAITVTTDANEDVVALTCNLIIPPNKSESNAEYSVKLIACLASIGLPTPVV